MLKTPFFLGDLALPNNIFYAPLAGCSDYPFRRMACRYRPGLLYCEMVKMDALVRHDPHTYHFLHYAADMHPIGAQICGSKPQLAAESARIIEDLGFDVIDFNCGCPVDKVTKDGSGSGMLKTPRLIGEIIANMVAAVRIPVTVKIRAGWDKDTLNAPQITRIAEQAGAKAITIHGRTREQGYQGDANLDIIRSCKEAAQHIAVIGNGDIFDAPSAIRMFTHTRCDAILVARGTLGQPWIVEDIMRSILQQEPVERPPHTIRDNLLQHCAEILCYHNDVQALLDFRRICCWYLKRCPGTKPLRIAINQCTNARECLVLIHQFPGFDIPK